jgi:hypothetical protein
MWSITAKRCAARVECGCNYAADGNLLACHEKINATGANGLCADLAAMIATG